MPSSAAGPQVRALNLNTDVLPLLRLMQEVETVDQTGEPFSEAKLRLYLSAPEHNPETDRWVIEHPEHAATLIGHAALFLPSPADERRVADGAVLVHPAWRRRGLGTKLTAHLERRLQDGPNIRTFRAYLDPRHEGAKVFAGRWSLSPNLAGAYVRLSAELSKVALEPELPAGFTLRSHRAVNSLSTVVEAMNRSYEGLYGHRTTNEAEFAPLLAGMDEDGFFLLFDSAGRVAGAVSAEPVSIEPVSAEVDPVTAQQGVSTGHLGSPGVVPEHRSPELYQALLLWGVAYLKARGVVLADLETWGDDAATLAVYKRCGFEVCAHALAYSRDL